MENRAWLPPLLLILLTGSISSSGAQEMKVVLSGTVIDSVRRQPVSGVRILLSKTGGGLMAVRSVLPAKESTAGIPIQGLAQKSG